MLYSALSQKSHCTFCSRGKYIKQLLIVLLSYWSEIYSTRCAVHSSTILYVFSSKYVWIQRVKRY